MKLVLVFSGIFLLLQGTRIVLSEEVCSEVDGSKTRTCFASLVENYWKKYSPDKNPCDCIKCSDYEEAVKCVNGLSLESRCRSHLEEFIEEKRQGEFNIKCSLKEMAKKCPQAPRISSGKGKLQFVVVSLLVSLLTSILMM